LKEKYALLGRWLISNIPTNFNYVYEIYKKDNKYIGVSLHKNFDFNTEILERTVDLYKIKHSNVFYKIDSKMNLTIHGLDEDNGYSAVFINNESDDELVNLTRNIIDSLFISVRQPFDEGKEYRVRLEKSSLSVEENQMLNTWRVLLNELMVFKNTEHFKQYGFARNGDYNNWRYRVEKLETDTTLNNRGIYFGDLLILSIYYVGNEEGDNVTRSFHDKFDRALNLVDK
jgi:hypothetical protein